MKENEIKCAGVKNEILKEPIISIIEANKLGINTIINETNYSEFNKEFHDYFGNYCQSIEYKLFVRYNTEITPFSLYINDKCTNVAGNKKTSILLKNSLQLSDFENEIKDLFAMPRINDNEIEAQQKKRGIIFEKYNNANFRTN